FAYNGQTLQQVGVLNLSPNGGGAAIGQSGEGLSADSNGNLFFGTGNGTFDASSAGADFGDSILKVSLDLASHTFAVPDYFTPFDQDALNTADNDLGSSGVLLLPPQSGTVPTIAITLSKGGELYSLNRDNLGHIHPTDNNQAVQTF